MATITTAWGDGTADVIRITYTGSVGKTTMNIAGDRNKTTKQRKRVLKLQSIPGLTLGTLIVTQKPRARAFKISYKPDYK